MNPLASRQRLQKTQLEFVKTEIELGFTFATIARDARDPEKFKRNRGNAVRAYDETSRFVRETSLSDGELQQIRFGIAKLRSALALLGEHA
jgi:hypothetical protein